MSTDRHVSWVCQRVHSERKALLSPMSCFNANNAGSINANNERKKSGGHCKWLFCFQSNDFQSKGILSLKMQTSFIFWSVQFVKLSDPRSEGSCICIDLALLIHLRLNLWIPFYDGGILMTIKPISHNTSNIYTALRQFLSELSPETLRDRSGLLTPFCTQRGSNLLNVTW